MPVTADKRPTLTALLNDELLPPLTFANFEEFLRTREHSEENLDFLRAAKRYREQCMRWAKEMEKEMADLLKQFVEQGAPREVNCADKIRKKVLEDVRVNKEYDPQVLLPIEEKIFELMRLSSLPQFLRFVEETDKKGKQ